MSEVDPRRARRALRQHVEAARLAGVEAVPWAGSFDQAEPAPPTPQRPRAHVESRRPAPPPPAAAPPPTLMPRHVLAKGPRPDDPAAALAGIKTRMLADERVVRLMQGATQLVFGEGDPDAALMFVGEGPGETEDRLGRPFVGPAGELLNKMIKAMGLERSAVYIANVVPFRPPGNRVPTPEEVGVCLPYLIEQMHTVSPKAIVSLGGSATKALLETQTGITRMRGSWQTCRLLDPPREVMPTFHPAYLLRSYTKQNRERVWSDLQQVMKRIESAA